MKQKEGNIVQKNDIDGAVVCAASEREKAFMKGICAGNTEMVKMLALTLDDGEYGENSELSEDKLQTIKYRFAIAVSLIARSCAANGMPMEEALSMGSSSIAMADKCDNCDAVKELFADINAQFARQMRRVNETGDYSRQVVRAADYINDNLHSRIRINEAAAHLNLSPSYLSRLFKGETGVAFSDYVNRKKAEEAADLLRWSDYSDLEISNMLCFSSQSYFIKVFRRYIGSTPKEYRKDHRKRRSEE